MHKALRHLLPIIMLPLISYAQDAPIFPRGEKAPNVNHVGNVWLNELAPADKFFNYSTSLATFDRGAYLNWHKHPGGQILLITSGTGYYQERGKPRQTVRKGDVIKCQPGIEHWHGATPESGVTYLATSPTQNGKTVWLERVSDDQYNRPTHALDKAANQDSATKNEVVGLAMRKWKWMADKTIDSLARLFHEKSVFVHMGGSWGKERELEVIKNGSIWYKKAEVYSVAVNFIGNTAILLNEIDLVAVVGGNEVVNPFMVTEVYINEGGEWTMGSLTFSRLMRPVKLITNQ